MADWWGADVYVDFAWGDAPLTADASCTWVDETAYVRRVATRRGRTSELSPVSPGTMSVSLDNSTRRFDPANTAGAHYGELLPMTKVRFRAGAGSTLVVFSGFVLGWPQAYPGMTDSVVQVQCVDAMRVLEQSVTPGSAYGAAVMADSPTYYWPMQEVDEAGGSPASAGTSDLVSLGVAGEVGPFTTSAASTLPVGQPTMLAAGRASVTDISTLPGAIEFWTITATGADTFSTASARLSATSYFSVAYLSQADTIGGVVFPAIQVFYSDPIGNKTADASTGAATFVIPSSASAAHVAVTVSASTIAVYLNGVAIGSSALVAGTVSYPSFIGPGVRFAVSAPVASAVAVSHVAVYNTAPSATRILAHYQAGTIAHGHPMGERTGERIGRILDAVGWPSADRDISTGSTVCGQWEPAGDSALSQVRPLEELEQGLFFIAGDGRAAFRSRNWFHVNSRAITPRYTYGDGGGSEIPYGDIEIDGNHLEHIRNTVTASYPGSSVTAKDATSRAAYGIQADSVDGSQLPTTGGWLARQLANYRLRARKDPATRIPTLEIDPRGAGVLSTTLPAVVDLDLGDRVRVIRRPNGSTDPIQVDCNVQGIAHTVDPGTWRTTLYLAPAVKSYTEANYLLIGDATYGVVGDGHLTSY